MNIQILKSTVTEMPRDEYDYDYIYNEEALREVDEKMVAEFRKAQVELLGGDEDLFEKVDASLKDIKVITEIENLQKKLYKWRMDFFREHFKLAADDACNW